jgi:hypothetical protein
MMAFTRLLYRYPHSTIWLLIVAYLIFVCRIVWGRW